LTLTVCYDPGTSLTKILYERDPSSQESARQVKYMTIAPEVISLPVGSAANLPGSSGLGKPQDNAWVQLTPDSNCYAVGRVARDYSATVSLNQLKHASLIPKVLAAVGAIAELEKLGNNFPIDFSLLMPYGELANRKEVEEQLREALSSFYFREQPMKVQMQHYYCVSEGGGIAVDYARRQGIEQFRNKTIAFLMLGYRNTSLLLFRAGTLERKTSSTTTLGFANLIDKFRDYIPSISREQVQEAIWSSHNKTVEVFDDLANLLNLDPASIEASFQLAASEYWQLLKDWLEETIPSTRQLDSIVSCGGTSDFLSQELKEYLGTKLEVVEESQRHLLQALQLDLTKAKKFEEQKLAVRFADCWGIYVKFAAFPIEQFSKRPLLV